MPLQSNLDPNAAVDPAVLEWLQKVLGQGNASQLGNTLASLSVLPRGGARMGMKAEGAVPRLLEGAGTKTDLMRQAAEAAEKAGPRSFRALPDVGKLEPAELREAEANLVTVKNYLKQMGKLDSHAQYQLESALGMARNGRLSDSRNLTHQLLTSLLGK